MPTLKIILKIFLILLYIFGFLFFIFYDLLLSDKNFPWLSSFYFIISFILKYYKNYF